MAANSQQTILTNVVPIFPSITQNRSRLMRLPAEVHLMILRKVLISSNGRLEKRDIYTRPTPIRSFSFEPSSISTVKKTSVPGTGMVLGYRLQPSILLACQDLLREGLPVLYGKNTLVLIIEPHCYENILRKAPKNAVLYIFPYTKSSLIQWRTKHRCSVKVNENAQAMASRFSRFEIRSEIFDVPHFDCSALRDIMRYLQSIMAGCSLYVNLNRCSRQANKDRLIRAFQYLRCKTFKMSNYSGDIEFDIASNVITKVVVSDTPVLDLHVAAGKLEDIKTFLLTRADEDVKARTKRQFRDMETAIDYFDREEFEISRAKVISRYELEIAKLAQLTDGTYDADPWKVT